MAWKEAKKQKELDEKKRQLIEKKLDYAYLEELIQRVNENPNLRVQIKHKDGFEVVIDTTPKKQNIVLPNYQENDFIEVS